MSERDIDELFRKFAILDAELKQLRKEMDEMLPKKKQWLPQWEENLSDNELWDEENK